MFIVGTLLFGAFLSLFSLSLDFNLFARFSIGVILFSIILLSLCLSLSGRFVASALLNMFFLVDSIDSTKSGAHTCNVGAWMHDMSTLHVWAQPFAEGFDTQSYASPTLIAM